MQFSDEQALLQFAQLLNSFGRELTCPICLSFLRQSARLPCNHYFCRECIECYLKTNSRCPVCKSAVAVAALRSAPSMDSIIERYRILLAPPSDGMAVSPTTNTGVATTNTAVSTTDTAVSATDNTTLPASEGMTFSQPLSPTKYIRLQTGAIIASPRKSHTHSELATRRFEKKSREHAYVFLVTGLSAAQRRVVSHVCTNSSARMTAEYCDEVTHCITACSRTHEGAFLAKRTTKYLQCVLGHKPILAFDWIVEVARVVDFSLAEERAARHSAVLTVCVPAAAFPSWTPYLVKGDVQAARLVPGGPERSLHSSLRLFDGLRFIVAGDFFAPLPQRQVVEMLLEMGGGQVVMEDKDAIVVVDERGREGHAENPVRVVFLWAFDSISNFQLEPFETYSCTLS